MHYLQLRIELARLITPNLALLKKLLYKFTAKLPCRLIDSRGKPYLERYFVGQLFGYTFYLHRFVAGDGDRALHDHPWASCTALCLAGGYEEKRLRWFDPEEGLHCQTKSLRPGRINRLSADTFHQITSVQPETWTLFFHSKKIKGWGFMEDVQKSMQDGIQHIRPDYYGDPDTSSHNHWWEAAAKGRDAGRVVY